ncbi:MAG: sulfotransferase [Cryomorphaceae bacterium]
MSSKLDFLFVGTAKAGTTTLYHYLNQHPEISIPVKETFYYLREIYKHNSLPYPQQRPDEELVLDKARFNALYRNADGRKQGEIGTGYLYHHKESIPLIKEQLGEDGKILIVLRHPTDRCYSSYKHFAKDLHETCSFEESLEKEKERVEKNWDFMWHHRGLSLYADQVEAFMNEFKHVKILIYEEFIESPEETVREIFEFLGVSPDFSLQSTRKYNSSGEPRFKFLQRMVTQENPVKAALRPVFRKVFDKERREKIRKGVKNRNLKKSDPLPGNMLEKLDTSFKTDIEKLESLLGRPIEAWKR